MFQIDFSEQSTSELNKIDSIAKLQLVNQISNLTDKALDDPNSEIGRFHRKSIPIYRYRTQDYRVYLRKLSSKKLFCYYILPKNTLVDFLVRFKLPVTEELLIEQHESWWRYLETLGKDKK